MIAPASRSVGELVHITHSIRNHFAKSLDRRARTKIAATEVSRQAARRPERSTMRRQVTMYILPRRDDVKIRARHAQLYRGKMADIETDGPAIPRFMSPALRSGTGLARYSGGKTGGPSLSGRILTAGQKALQRFPCRREDKSDDRNRYGADQRGLSRRIWLPRPPIRGSRQAAGMRGPQPRQRP